MSKHNNSYYSKINKIILDLPKSAQKEFKHAIESNHACKEIPLSTKYEVRKINTKSKDLFRNTVYNYSLKERAKKKIIDKIQEETKIFSQTYKSISKSNKKKINNNLENVSENIVMDYKSKGYDLKNLFPKDNLFTNSLLLEINPAKYKNVLEVEPKECKKSIKYINHLQNITKGNNFKKYKRIILKESKEKENYLLNNDNQDDDDLDKIFNINKFNKINLNKINKLQKDINLTERTINNIDNLNLNDFSPIKKKNSIEIKFFDNNNYNNNNSNLNKSRNIRKKFDTKLKTMFFNKNNNRKITIINNKFKTIDKDNNDDDNDNNNDNKLNHTKNISKDLKNIRKDLRLGNRFKTLADKAKDEEYEIDERLNIYNERKKKELIREYKRKKELFDLYNQCKYENFENSEKLINGYLRKYDRISPVKKLNYNYGSNLHGFLNNFMTKTSLTNIPDIIYKVKAKTGDYTIKLNNLDKCVNIDKNINNLEYKYTEDILKLNEDIYKTKI